MTRHSITRTVYTIMYVEKLYIKISANIPLSPTRMGGLGGHEPHMSDLRTPLFAKLTSEPHISGSEPHTTGFEPHITVSSFFFFCNAFNCLTNEKSQKNLDAVKFSILFRVY